MPVGSCQAPQNTFSCKPHVPLELFRRVVSRFLHDEFPAGELVSGQEFGHSISIAVIRWPTNNFISIYSPCEGDAFSLPLRVTQRPSKLGSLEWVQSKGVQWRLWSLLFLLFWSVCFFVLAFVKSQQRHQTCPLSLTNSALGEPATGQRAGQFNRLKKEVTTSYLFLGAAIRQLLRE